MGEGGGAYLCACLFSSWRRVSAGLESGLGPRRFGFSPSASSVSCQRANPNSPSFFFFLSISLFLSAVLSLSLSLSLFSFRLSRLGI